MGPSHLSFSYEEIDGQTVEVDTRKQGQEQEQNQRHDGSSLSRDGDAADGEAFEFRLFASSGLAAGDDGLARVNIRSPTPVAGWGEGGFVVPFRPPSYYFTLSGDAEWKRKRDEYLDVAVEGQDVWSLAGKTAWVRPSSVVHVLRE